MIAAALVLGPVVAGCGATPAPEHGVITLGVSNSPNNLDPRVGTDEASQRVHQLVFDPLFRIDDQLRVGPGLATHWETPDELTYVVHLRRGVAFHDGRELTASDVVYTFSSFLDADFVSARKGAYRTLSSVAAVDRYSIEFKLREPFGSFPVNLVMPIVPSGAGPETRSSPIGTGPYRFVSARADDRIVLSAFEDYHLGRPRNAGLILKVVPDDIMRGLELRNGGVDLVINDLVPDIVHQLQRESRLQVLTSPGTDYAYIGINLRDPILSDVRVRHAIGHAIDREAIVNHLRRGLAVPAVGVLPPASWAFRPDVFTFNHDPERARRLLDEAGYPDPDGDGPLPRFRLSLKVSSTEFNRLQSAVIQQDLRKVGIALDVRVYEFATLYSDVLRGNFQLFTLQWVGVSDPDMLRRVFHSRQMPPAGFNRGFYESLEVDTIIDAATVTIDEERRRSLYWDAQAIIAESAPYISLWYKVNVAVSQPDVRGLRLTPATDFSVLREVYLEPSRRQSAGGR
jgi:peptide/nickel transport system substrate-binding protein